MVEERIEERITLCPIGKPGIITLGDCRESGCEYYRGTCSLLLLRRSSRSSRILTTTNFVLLTVTNSIVVAILGYHLGLSMGVSIALAALILGAMLLCYSIATAMVEK